MDVGIMNEEAIKAMDADVMAEVEDAYKFAEEAPEPDAAELYTDVYAPEG
jgi:pyruvate dehydrogenase E1 component alpha subunit